MYLLSLLAGYDRSNPPAVQFAVPILNFTVSKRNDPVCRPADKRRGKLWVSEKRTAKKEV
jgi:hypothetical protein